MKRVFLMWAFLAPVLAAAGDVILNGSGATFPFPLYRKWISVYQGRSGIRVTYQGVGSGSGIRQLLQQSVDFGATDAFMNDEEMSRAPRPVLHLPTCVGAVVVTYNLPGNPAVRLTPDLLADLFLGRIKRWSDPRLAEVNGGATLPDQPVTVVHRSESSGTTFLFTDYLARVSPEWNRSVGRGKTVKWASGMGVEGNPALAEMIKRIAGSVGYVELTYAQNQRLPMASLRNRSGRYVPPNVNTVNAAADVPIPADTRILLTDTEAAEGYPISAFTYLIFYREQAYGTRTLERAKILSDLLWWMIHDGQAFNREMGYAPLPPAAVDRAEEILRSMTFNGKPLG
jgi:phosphate transport system substrate-binding protein